MKRYNSVYRYIGMANAALHTLLVVFLVIVGFLPFHEQRNFYQAFGGVLTSFGYLLMPLAAAVFAVLAVKRPLWSLVTTFFASLFFFSVIFPYTVEATIVGFSSPWIDSSMSLWQQGFTLMSGAANILFWGIAFVIYAIVTVIIRTVHRKREKENNHE